jgi:hypothetical protein
VFYFVTNPNQEHEVFLHQFIKRAIRARQTFFKTPSVRGGGGGSHFGGPSGATLRMLDGGEWRRDGVIKKHSALRAGIFKA